MRRNVVALLLFSAGCFGVLYTNIPILIKNYNIKSVYRECLQFASEREGRFPGSFDDLFEMESFESELLLRPNMDSWMDRNLFFISEKHPRDDGLIYVITIGGEIVGVESSDVEYCQFLRIASMEGL